jgi:hypothetical protein
MTIQLESLPAPLLWEMTPVGWHSDGPLLTISAGAHTDLFTSPAGDGASANSPRLLFRPDHNDFVLSARVQVNFASTFDAGVLLIYGDERRWAKLCFEYSPQCEPMVVSVVNREVSDDCNSVIIDGNMVYLRIARMGPAYAFHYSLDGIFWRMVRHFTLGAGDHAVGFSCQSPTGAGCTADFSDVRFAAHRLGDLRSGE